MAREPDAPASVLGEEALAAEIASQSTADLERDRDLIRFALSSDPSARALAVASPDNWTNNLARRYLLIRTELHHRGR